MREDGKIDYVELPGRNLSEVKRFYSAAFGWRFVDYGPAYIAVEEAGLDGGFNAHEGASDKPLVILYAEDVEAMQAEVEAAGGRILRPVYSFPGGRRFHFADPAGNELAGWGPDPGQPAG